MASTFVVAIDASISRTPPRRVTHMLSARVRIVVTAPETMLEVPDCITEPTTVFVLYVPDFSSKEGNEKFITELRGFNCFQQITTLPWQSDSSGVTTLPCICDDAESYLDARTELKALAKKYARQPV